MAGTHFHTLSKWSLIIASLSCLITQGICFNPTPLHRRSIVPDITQDIHDICFNITPKKIGCFQVKLSYARFFKETIKTVYHCKAYKVYTMKNDNIFHSFCFWWERLFVCRFCSRFFHYTWAYLLVSVMKSVCVFTTSALSVKVVTLCNELSCNFEKCKK